MDGDWNQSNNANPDKNNTNHSTLSGISGKKAKELFNPTIKNPSKNK